MSREAAKGLVASAAFAALPIAWLIASNPGEPLPVLRFVIYWLVVVCCQAVALLLVDRLLPTIAARTATAVALSVFGIFYLAVAVRSVLETTTIITLDVSVWLGVVFVIAAILLSRFRFVRAVTPVLAVVLLAYPLVDILVHGIDHPQVAPSSNTGQAWDIRPSSTPNIYWIVADGYAGPDVLTEDYGSESESEFVDALTDLAFHVSNPTVAAYPITYLSMSSTLAMDYLVESGDNVSDRRPFFQIMQGDNPVVATLRNWEYEFDIYPGSLYPGSQCTATADVCLKEVTFAPADWALLSMTPIASLIEGPRTVAAQARLSNPLSILNSLSDHPADHPRFVMAHLLEPHPPFWRGGENCSIRDVPMNIGAPWEPAADYAGAVDCLNPLLQSMVVKLTEQDPDAVIVIQGDHGPNRGVALDHGHDVAGWTDEQIRLRFSALSAMRLPDGCSPPDPMSLVNTFRVTFDCLSDESIPLLPIRTFTANTDPGDVLEIDPPL